MKYDSYLSELKTKLTSAQKILIALPAEITEDNLSAGLSLFLSLQQERKDVSIVTVGVIKVSHTNLFGVGKVGNLLSKNSGGNLTVTLEGVVSNGSVPALEKLDWYPEGSNLNLVFHVLPGQKFEPAKISHSYSGAGFDLIFCLGAPNLSDLGTIYSNNLEVFSNTLLVNIDNSTTNSNFGKINIVDSQASSLSEMIGQIIPDLNLPLDQDAASNIITGIINATSNLTSKVNPDTFLTLGRAMQSGGVLKQATPMPAPQDASNIPFSQISSQDPSYLPDWLNFKQPQTQVQESPQDVSNTQINSSSPEEQASGEYATSSDPEVDSPAPDWLTPKIFKSGSLE